MAGACIGSLLNDPESRDVALAGEGHIISKARRKAAKGDKTPPGLSAREPRSWRCKSAVRCIFIMERPFPHAAKRLEMSQAPVSTVLAYSNAFISPVRLKCRSAPPYFL